MNPTAAADAGASAPVTTGTLTADGHHAPHTAAPTGRSGLAVAGLVVGIVALLLSAIPLVNILSVLGGIAAVVVGVTALRRLAPGAPGRGLAVAAIVLGGLATAIATAVLLVLGTLVITADGATVEELGPEEVVYELGDSDVVVVEP